MRKVAQPSRLAGLPQLRVLLPPPIPATAIETGHRYLCHHAQNITKAIEFLTAYSIDFAKK
jgi:hypothetical protein